MTLRIALVIGAGLFLTIAACTTVKTPPDATTIALDKTVHFSAPDGSDVAVAPGTYRVERAEETRLSLLPMTEGEQKPALIIEALASQHVEQLTGPLALSIAHKEDEHHIVFLLPEGGALDAVGSYSGVRARGALQPLSQVAVKQHAQIKASYAYVRPELKPATAIALLGAASFSARLDVAADLGSICAGCALPSTDVITVDENSRIYVKDRWQGIAVFDHAGQKIGTFGGNCRLDQEVSSVNCPDPDGEGPLQPGDGQFGGVGGLGVARNGNRYVADEGNHRVVVFDAAGKYVRTFGSRGSGPGQLYGPRHLDIADDGRVYVEDRFNGRIQVFNGDGSFNRSLQVPGAPRIRNGKLFAMALGASGCTMRVLSLDGALLQEYEVCRLVLREGATGWSAYDDFEVDASGNYYFLDIYESGVYWGYIHLADASFRKLARYGTIHEPRGILLRNMRGALGRSVQALQVAAYHLYASNQPPNTRLTMFDVRQLTPQRRTPLLVAGDDRLNDPNDIDVSSDSVFVLDRNNQRIVSYDLQGQFRRAHAFPFTSRLNTNWANDEFAVRSGNFIIAEAQSGRVTTQNIESGATSQFLFNQQTPSARIAALEVAPDGDIYVAGRYQEVARYSSTGQLKATYECGIALYPGPAVALKYDAGIGKLYAASRSGVAVIDADGNCAAIPTRYYGPDGTFDMFGGNIQSIAMDSQQRIYVLQAERVQVFDRDWKLLDKFGAPGTEPGEFSGATAIAVGSDDRAYVLQSRWGFSDGITRQRYQVFKF